MNATFVGAQTLTSAGLIGPSCSWSCPTDVDSNLRPSSTSIVARADFAPRTLGLPPNTY